MSFLSELRERKVVRMAIIYAVAGWGLLQIADIAAGVLSLPDWTLRFTLTLIVLCFPLALILSWFFRLTPEGLRWETPPAPARASVAVLPFRLENGDEADAWLADGLTEETLQALAGIPELRVASRRSCFRLRDSAADVREAAERLGVDHVVEGVVSRHDGLVSVYAELVDAAADAVIWSESWQHRDGIAPTVHQEIARRVAAALNVPTRRRVEGERATSAAAYHAWLRGRHAARRNTAEGYREAVACFEEAIALDAEFAPPRAALARAYVWLSRYGLVPATEGFRRARDAADDALALDPQLAAAHLAVAELQLSDDRDFTAAEASLRRALELEPASAEIHAHLGHLLAMLGRFDEAITVRRRAVELDPLAEGIHLGLADTLFLAGRYDEARHELTRIRELAPDFPVTHLEARIALAEDRAEDALAAIADEPLEWRRLYIRAIALRRLGRVEEARATLDELTRLYGDEIALQAAIVNAEFGETDEAFRWLETAIRHRDPGLIELKADPELATLRTDPRYAGMLRRAGFP